MTEHNKAIHEFEYCGATLINGNEEFPTLEPELAITWIEESSYSLTANVVEAEISREEAIVIMKKMKEFYNITCEELN